MGQQSNMVGVTGKKLAIIARQDDSGLGHQTRDLVRLLNPNKVVAIDFSFYNGFKQHPEWYKDYDTKTIEGFIQDGDVHQLMQEVDIVLTAETFYNNRFIDIANQSNVITINQINYEFFEPLSNRSLLIPTRILMPSYWHLQDLINMTEPGRVEYLPPPMFVEDFTDIYEENLGRTGKRRFLHTAGKMATHDRAGTRDLIEAMKYTNVDFELVIKVQNGEMLVTNDPRISLDYSFPEDERELYRGFDAMIQPRRYAGLNLPMNEALSAGLPVIMTDIDPNNKVLPSNWLVPATKQTTFMARTMIDVYSAGYNGLADKITQFAIMDNKLMNNYKTQARQIAIREYSSEVIKEKWSLLIKKLGV